MKSSEICTLAIQVATWQYGQVWYRKYNEPTDYGGYYNLLSWEDGRWHADCLGMVRALLCGWNANKNVIAGGADTSYRCYNYTEQMMIDSCTDVSANFAVMTPCELLYKAGHVGMYVGEFMSGGKTYNAVECTTSYGAGGLPTYVFPTGQRSRSKEEGAINDYWLKHGKFNLNGVDYGITEYDGGAVIGATGFGSELTQEEVLSYYDTLPELTYDYLESLANTLYGMSPDIFKIFAGWEWGEGYEHIDLYMGYLCACIPINGFYAYNMTTPQNLASWIAGGDSSYYYSVESFNNRANNLKQNENTPMGQVTLKILCLALLNPCQRVVFCNGVPPKPSADRIIYEITLSGGTEIWAFTAVGQTITYDITGTGIRGGLPNPSGKGKAPTRIWQYLRPYQLYSQYRNNLLF